jgi:hypothetical protein
MPDEIPEKSDLDAGPIPVPRTLPSLEASTGPIQPRKKRQNIGMFLGFAGILFGAYISLLIVNGLTFYWLWSVAAYAAIIFGCSLTFFNHLVPHCRKLTRWVGSVIFVITLGVPAIFAIHRQYVNQHTPKVEITPEMYQEYQNDHNFVLNVATNDSTQYSLAEREEAKSMLSQQYTEEVPDADDLDGWVAEYKRKRDASNLLQQAQNAQERANEAARRNSGAKDLQSNYENSLRIYYNAVETLETIMKLVAKKDKDALTNNFNGFPPHLVIQPESHMLGVLDVGSEEITEMGFKREKYWDVKVSVERGVSLKVGFDSGYVIIQDDFNASNICTGVHIFLPGSHKYEKDPIISTTSIQEYKYSIKEALKNMVAYQWDYFNTQTNNLVK